MADVPFHLGNLDVGVAKEIVVQMPYEASNRLRRRINVVGVVSHNIHRDSATISRHRDRRAGDKRAEWRAMAKRPRNMQESRGNRQRRAAVQRLSPKAALPALVRFPPKHNGCIVARPWRFELSISLYLYASSPGGFCRTNFASTRRSDIVDDAGVDYGTTPTVTGRRRWAGP